MRSVGEHFTMPISHKKVFSENHPLQLYAVCALIMKRVDAHLRAETLGLNRKDQTNLRFYVAMVAAMKLAADRPLTSRTVANLAVDKLTVNELNEALAQAKAAY